MVEKSSSGEVALLKKELRGLFDHIRRMRLEVAAIRRPGAKDDSDHFSQMSDELDAIVHATENATDGIMSSVEELEDLLSGLKGRLANDPEGLAALDKVPELTGAIFESCSFQDITGQRISKVVKSLQYIEERVNTLISMWGSDTLAETETDDEPEDFEQSLLNGPQLAGKGVDQSDIDAMLGGTPAPPPKPAEPESEPTKKSPAPPPNSVPPSNSVPPPPEKKASPPSKPKPSSGDDDEGGGMGQGDIDNLFG